jgi:hypothetical protein
MQAENAVHRPNLVSEIDEIDTARKVEHRI